MTLRLALDVGSIREHEFDRAQVSVGRGPLNDLVLNVEGMPKTLGMFVRQDTHYDWVCETNASTIQLHRNGKIQFKNHNAASRWTLAQGDVLKVDGTGASIEVISCDPQAMEPIIHHFELEHRDVAISAPHARAVAAHPHPGALLRALTQNVLSASTPIETFITSFDGHEVPHRATWAMCPTGHENGIAVGSVEKAVDPLTRLDRHTVDCLSKLEAGHALRVHHKDVFSVYVPLGTPLRAYATFDYPPDLHDSAVLRQIAYSARELEPLAKLCFDLCDQQQPRERA
ncbi:MAG: hypothetical protein R3E66_02085 [bacterium]